MSEQCAPSTRSEHGRGRTGLRVCSKEPVRIECHWVRVLSHIVRQIPTTQVISVESASVVSVGNSSPDIRHDD